MAKLKIFEQQKIVISCWLQVQTSKMVYQKEPMSSVQLCATPQNLPMDEIINLIN